ncbi:MAG: hypothetical protein IPL53_18520 [Ignavibacteria bacterium]|nr:hypothetical protein [Ignavibacteria bacterium]
MKKNHFHPKSFLAAILLITLSLFIQPVKTSADIVGTNRALPVINVFQDLTWNVLSSNPITLTGYTIERAPSITWNSDNLLFYIILRTTSYATSRRLATINPAPGICTDIGDMGGNFSSLTYSAATRTLCTMGGTGSGLEANSLLP